MNYFEVRKSKIINVRNRYKKGELSWKREEKRNNIR